MPSNQFKLSSSDMEPEFHSPRLSDIKRNGSFDSQESRCSRSRSFNLKDDENLRYLTNEEKNVLLFFEETLDAFEDDIVADPPLCHNEKFRYLSPIPIEGSHSENYDIIDLVHVEEKFQQLTPQNSKIVHERKDEKLTELNTKIHTSSPGEKSIPEMAVEHRKLHGAIPTPVVIAKKISEKCVDNIGLSALSSYEGKPELKKSVGTSPISENNFIFPLQGNIKPNNFPSNINVKQVGKQYNKTIAKAAVSVQERKAKVLANISGPSIVAEETDGRVHNDPLSRKTSFRDIASEQTRYEALTKLGLVKETPVQTGIQTVCASTSPITDDGPLSPNFFPPDPYKRLSNDNHNISSSLNNYHSPLAPYQNLPNEPHTRYSSELQNSSKNTKTGSKSSTCTPSNKQPHEQSRNHYSESKYCNKLKTEHFLPHKNVDNTIICCNQNPSSNNNIKAESSHSSLKSDPYSYSPPKSLAFEINKTDSQSISNILKSDPSPFVSLGKTVIFKGESSLMEKNNCPTAPSQDIIEQKMTTVKQDIKRSYSVPRPSGFRPQGITVQFSGREASEDSRKDALRKLGLLKKMSGY
ncbi:hypothetical protein GDO86_005990 [Hymenochirus boettgeri]|uniref:Proline and serine rich 2 n=1 Tax=Hymenochirus boettgeri TaxID=247094 RepID=A0A8T2J985_9PIPI|nr:hypothetical protein GDO86_005990 [Hymenochirus boettgeri]